MSDSGKSKLIKEIVEYSHFWGASAKSDAENAVYRSQCSDAAELMSKARESQGKAKALHDFADEVVRLIHSHVPEETASTAAGKGGA